jgi:hypothetical protein
MYARKGLDLKRALAARRSNERKLNKLSLISDADAGTYGLFNFPGITEATLPADGVNGSKSWSTKSVDQILRDIDILLGAVIDSTKGAENPDTLLLPLPAFRKLTNLRLGDNTISLMKYIRENYPQLTNIDFFNELTGIGEGGSNRVFVGQVDSDHVENQIINYFEQLETEKTGGEYEIPCLTTTAGVIVYYPMAFAFADGI